MTGALRLLGRVSPGALVLRLVVWLAPVAALELTGVGGPRPRVLLLAVVLVLSTVAAITPDSPLLTVCLGLVVAWWALAARDAVPAVALAAGVLVLVTHLAATVLGYGPPSLALDAALVRRWTVRGALLALVVLPVWLLADAAQQRPGLPGEWAVGLAIAAAVCVLGVVSARSTR